MQIPKLVNLRFLRYTKNPKHSHRTNMLSALMDASHHGRRAHITSIASEEPWKLLSSPITVLQSRISSQPQALLILSPNKLDKSLRRRRAASHNTMSRTSGGEGRHPTTPCQEPQEKRGSIPQHHVKQFS